MNKEKQKGSIKLLIVILMVLIIVAGILLALKIVKDKKDPVDNNVVSLGKDNGIEEQPPEEVVPPIKIYSGNERSVAVMIDNHTGALPQAGLNDAYIVYEIIVEGGESRLMPIFKGKNLEKIGPIRSARHYFLDYALENDSIYVHYGQSPQAEKDISKLGINNIHGLVESEKYFWRVKDKTSPHDVITTSAKITELIDKKGYRKISTKDSVLSYVPEEVELTTSQAISAVDIKVPYCDWNVVEYKYNEDSKRYVRYSKNKKQTDWDSKMDITTKNIIITFAKNTLLNDGENKDRQNLSNIGTLKGYYITNGKAIEITCEKSSRSAQTVYKDLQGNEIKVNDGNTWVQICPIDAKVEIE